MFVALRVPGGYGITRALLRSDFVPVRIFLDSNALQAIQDYGDAIFERQEFVLHGRSGADRHDVDALCGIFIFVERGAFQFALSANSLREVADRGDPGYLQWAFDVLDHWEASVGESRDAFVGSGQERVRLLHSSRFGYLSRKDAALIRDAVLLESDTFLTLDRKLARNAVHISRELGLEVLRPPELWEVLRPHLGGL
jgi:hypothetical protein